MFTLQGVLQLGVETQILVLVMSAPKVFWHSRFVITNKWTYWIVFEISLEAEKAKNREYTSMYARI